VVSRVESVKTGLFHLSVETGATTSLSEPLHTFSTETKLPGEGRDTRGSRKPLPIP